MAKVYAWLGSGQGLHAYADIVACHARVGVRRTVHRWLDHLLPGAMRLQQAHRSAVIESFEPQPVELLFPGGVSPPAAVRRRRWKDPDAVYSLFDGLSFLFDGVLALGVTAPVLLAEAHRRLDGPFLIAAS